MVVTYFLNFRTKNVGGAVTDPVLYEGDGTDPASGWSLIPAARIPSLFAGKNILFATHGFNVSQQQGANSLGLLDNYLKLTSSNLFVGMLWPGDSIIPIVDYPFEGSVAMDCGTRLAKFCKDYCDSAQALSFVSHSLGARFVLQAVANSGARPSQYVSLQLRSIGIV